MSDDDALFIHAQYVVLKLCLHTRNLNCKVMMSLSH